MHPACPESPRLTVYQVLPIAIDATFSCKSGAIGVKCDSSPTFVRAGKRKFDYVALAKKNLAHLAHRNPEAKIEELRRALKMVEELQRREEYGNN